MMCQQSVERWGHNGQCDRSTPPTAIVKRQCGIPTLSFPYCCVLRWRQNLPCETTDVTCHYFVFYFVPHYKTNPEEASLFAVTSRPATFHPSTFFLALMCSGMINRFPWLLMAATVEDVSTKNIVIYCNFRIVEFHIAHIMCHSLSIFRRNGRRIRTPENGRSR